MAAGVGGYPGGYNDYPGAFNTDPGVYEPECDWQEEQPAYPDTQQFIQQVQAMQQKQQQLQQQQADVAAAAAVTAAATSPAAGQQQLEGNLQLAGDYKGMGGPQSVPLYTPSAFEKPPAPEVNSILGEIFMEPTRDQLEAYRRVILKGRVAQTKNRLKSSIFLHYAMVFCIITKLLPEILDVVDIFVLEIEELFVPKPLLWEWCWLLSVPVTFFGLSACKKSNIIAIRRFMLGSLVFSLLPILVGMGCHAPDFYTFLVEDEGPEREAIFMWQGYPYAILWYVFFFIALQVHCYQLYFANSLMQAWMPPLKKTE